MPMTSSEVVIDMRTTAHSSLFSLSLCLLIPGHLSLPPTPNHNATTDNMPDARKGSFSSSVSNNFQLGYLAHQKVVSVSVVP